MTTIAKLTRSVRGLARPNKARTAVRLLEGYPPAPLLSHLRTHRYVHLFGKSIR
jgi:hypothetical protein